MYVVCVHGACVYVCMCLCIENSVCVCVCVCLHAMFANLGSAEPGAKRYGCPK